MWLRDLASLKSVGQTLRLETQGRTDDMVLSWNFAGSRLATKSGFLCCTVEENSFFYRKPQSLLLRSSTDCLRPTHTMEGNLSYSRASYLNVHLIQKHLNRNIQKAWPNIQHSSPHKLTHKIHHHMHQTSSLWKKERRWLNCCVFVPKKDLESPAN